MRHRRLAPPLALIGLLASTAGCGGGSSSRDLEVFGALLDGAESAEMVILADGETIERTVDANEIMEPIQVEGSFDVEVTVTNDGDEGAVGCAIDGLGRGGGGRRGDVSVTCRVSGVASGNETTWAATGESVARPTGTKLAGIMYIELRDGWDVEVEETGDELATRDLILRAETEQQPSGFERFGLELWGEPKRDGETLQDFYDDFYAEYADREPTVEASIGGLDGLRTQFLDGGEIFVFETTDAHVALMVRGRGDESAALEEIATWITVI